MSKPTTDWQPIDKLQCFVDLIEKMHCDTQAKVTKLSQTKDYAIFDVELASIIVSSVKSFLRLSSSIPVFLTLCIPCKEL